MLTATSPEEVGLVGTIIAAGLEAIKIVPDWLETYIGKENKQKLLKLFPLTAIVLGVAIDYFFIASPESSSKDILFEGAMFGLTAIGGREAVVSSSKVIKKN